jgi:hypothetical protein
LDNLSTVKPDASRVVDILHVLETQLVALDALGAQIAAAHLDAAIQCLREYGAPR